MATYTLDEVMSQSGPKTYSLEEVVGQPTGKPMSRTEKALQGAIDPYAGVAQIVQKMLPQSIKDKVRQQGAEMGLYVPEGGLDQQLKEREQQYQANRAAAGETGIDGYRMLGNVLSPATLGLGLGTPQAASTLGRVGVGALSGAAMGGMQPVVGGDFAAEKAKQVGAGAIGGAIIPAVTGAVSRVISPKASTNPNVQLLRQEGVTPTIGQTIGGRANALEEKLQAVPLMGDMITNARGKANAQFEKAAYNRALKPIGQELPDGLSGREALVHTEAVLRDKYDDVLNRIGAIAPDDKFASKLSELEGMVNKMVMPKAEKAKFGAAVNDIRQSIDQNGVITSDAYKALESSLGQDASKLGASTNIYEGKLSPAVKQLQAELRDMLQRQAGPLSKELKATNTGWANFKRVQNAATKLGAEEGEFTPSQFQNAVRVLDKSKDKSAFARGSAIGQDLGDAGKAVLGNKVPDSGTAQRLIYGAGALASGAVNPAIPMGLAGGAALYTSPAQKLLTGLIAKRPSYAPLVANAITRNGQVLVPAGAGVTYGLLNQ
jgi:hypothetical protein